MELAQWLECLALNQEVPDQGGGFRFGIKKMVYRCLKLGSCLTQEVTFGHKLIQLQRVQGEHLAPSLPAFEETV